MAGVTPQEILTDDAPLHARAPAGGAPRMRCSEPGAAIVDTVSPRLSL